MPEKGSRAQETPAPESSAASQVEGRGRPTSARVVPGPRTVPEIRLAGRYGDAGTGRTRESASSPGRHWRSPSVPQRIETATSQRVHVMPTERTARDFLVGSLG
jgi:hypothetical protein